MAWKPLDARELTKRIRIEESARTPNGQGGAAAIVWTPVLSLWAKKIPLRGDEIVIEGMTRAVNFARFVVRYQDNVSTNFRLVEIRRVAGVDEIIGKPWAIKRVDDPFGRRDRLEIDCEQGLTS